MFAPATVLRADRLSEGFVCGGRTAAPQYDRDRLHPPRDALAAGTSCSRKAPARAGVAAIPKTLGKTVDNTRSDGGSMSTEVEYIDPKANWPSETPDMPRQFKTFTSRGCS